MLGCAMVLCATGCWPSRADRDFENENDRLRREVVALEGRVARLQAERDELRARIAEDHEAPQEVLDALPRCVGIEIDRLSGLDHGPQRPARVVAYIRPMDSRGRFIQVAGTLLLEAHLLPEPGSSHDHQRWNIELGPADLRDAYRSGLTGTHYTVEIDVTEYGPGTLVFTAVFEDGLTGQVHRAHRSRVVATVD